jgi:hypothetical protein
MTENQQSPLQIEGADRLVEAARNVAQATKALRSPSESGPLLDRLRNAQLALDDAFLNLAVWHGGVVEGVHHHGEDEERRDPITPAWIRAEIALREAAAYGGNAADALERASAANAVAQWYDEEIGDER